MFSIGLAACLSRKQPLTKEPLALCTSLFEHACKGTPQEDARPLLRSWIAFLDREAPLDSDVAHVRERFRACERPILQAEARALAEELTVSADPVLVLVSACEDCFTSDDPPGAHNKTATMDAALDATPRELSPQNLLRVLRGAVCKEGRCTEEPLNLRPKEAARLLRVERALASRSKEDFRDWLFAWLGASLAPWFSGEGGEAREQACAGTTLRLFPHLARKAWPFAEQAFAELVAREQERVELRPLTFEERATARTLLSLVTLADDPPPFQEGPHRGVPEVVSLRRDAFFRQARGWWSPIRPLFPLTVNARYDKERLQIHLSAALRFSLKATDPSLARAVLGHEVAHVAFSQSQKKGLLEEGQAMGSQLSEVALEELFADAEGLFLALRERSDRQAALLSFARGYCEVSPTDPTHPPSALRVDYAAAKSGVLESFGCPPQSRMFRFMTAQRALPPTGE